MMQIQSQAYGLLEVEEEQIYSFEPGILGLTEIKQYALLPMKDTPFYVLHALQDQVSFILLPSHEVVENYSFRIPEDIISLMEISSPEDVGVMLIVNIQEENLYVNLMAPVLLAPHSRKGCQYVIKDQEFPIRHPLQVKEGK
jgi:flagellar assembly factor FliW